MIVVGLNLSPHDRSIAIVRDGHVIFATEEERLTREKHGLTYDDFYYSLEKDGEYFDSSFLNASSSELEKKMRMILNHAFDQLGISEGDVDFFVSANLYPNTAFQNKSIVIGHHLAHAASACYMSSFREAAVLVADGAGNYNDGEFETVSGYKFINGKIENVLKFSGAIKNYMDRPNNSIIGVFNSLGVLYKNISFLVGCGSMGEGKMMGLSSYGQGKYRDLFLQHIRVTDSGFLIDNQAIFLSVQEFLSKADSGDFQLRANLAKTCQDIHGEMSLELVRMLYKKFPTRNLCLAGGSFLNAITNSYIAENGPYEEVFIPSAPGDAGVAIGAALYGYHLFYPEYETVPRNLAYFGSKFINSEVEDALANYPDQLKYKLSEDIYSEVASILAGNSVVAWMQGASEFGPRALGHRSILANPSSKGMRDYLNEDIKYRESYRPVAPIILEEEFEKYFYHKKSESLRLMNLISTATELTKKKAPSAVHVDGTARIQLVGEDQKELRALLGKFFEITSIPILINTSFNLKDEPIVNSPKDAIRTFVRSNLQYLAIGNYLIEKTA